ncbi:hypothetical protein NDU88_002227 [Pleurodeles waltl]|uniref:Uncharacterized protein n=1 Tax=Pleurodeles waltl TaxID=8319 RepID=A0AAV7NHD6_PLEWA|nr:hypothetical protein NDU88_002227 [Pleurodeles waltl]
MPRSQLGPGRNYRATGSAQQHQRRRKRDRPPSKSQGPTITAEGHPEEHLVWPIIYIKQRATVPPGRPDMSKQGLEEVVRSGRSHRRAIRETQLREPVRCGRTVTGGLQDFSIRLGHPRGSADHCCRLQRLTPLLY